MVNELYLYGAGAWSRQQVLLIQREAVCWSSCLALLKSSTWRRPSQNLCARGAFVCNVCFSTTLPLYKCVNLFICSQVAGVSSSLYCHLRRAEWSVLGACTRIQKGTMHFFSQYLLFVFGVFYVITHVCLHLFTFTDYSFHKHCREFCHSAWC